MEFADNILTLKRVILYAAPAEHSPTPFTIPANRQIVEVITGGVVYFSSNGQRRLYRKGTIFWHITGDQTIFDTTRDAPYRCIVFQFESTTPERIAPRVSSWRGSSEAFDEFVSQIYSAFFAHNNDPGHLQLVSSYCLSELLMHALSLKELHGKSLIGQTADADEIMLRNVLMYIEDNLAGDLSSSTLTEKLKIPRNKLFALFSKFIKSTPLNYITEKRFEQARRLLESTNMPIKEIAASCGFDHVEVFHRSFVKRFNDTPKNYRLKSQPYHNFIN
jgi:AraC-like DNA-binding protein